MFKPLTLTIPLHKKTLYPHEFEILNAQEQFVVVVAHRRARKSTTILNKALIEATRQDKPPGMIYVVFPTATLARDAIWRDPSQIQRVIPVALIDRIQEQEMNIYLKTGSIIAVRGSDDVDRLTGTSGRFYALDEFPLMKADVFDRVVYPILQQNKGGAIISGTPRGKGRLYELFKRGQDPDYPNWKSFYYPVSVTNVIKPEELENIKREMPERLFQSEYLCSWSESEGVVFRNVREAAILEPRRPHPNKHYVIGIDLARLQDFTSISVFDAVTNEMVFLDRFNSLDWTFQTKRIKLIADRYNSAVCVVEANAVGDAVVDLLLREGVAVIPFKTTSISKKEIVEKTALYVESGKLKLLNDNLLIDEFENFGYSLTPEGNVKYGAMVGHDDIVMSVCLASSYLFPVEKERVTREESSMRKQYQRMVQKYDIEHNEEYPDPLDEFAALNENW